MKIQQKKRVVNGNIVRHKNYDLHLNFIRHGFCGDSDHPLTPCKLITLTSILFFFFLIFGWVMMVHESSSRAHDVHFMTLCRAIKHIYDFLRASFLQTFINRLFNNKQSNIFFSLFHFLRRNFLGENLTV